MITGRCECRAVAFEVREVRETVKVCHCSQCRRTSGHLWAGTKAKRADLTFLSDEGLTWYASSDFARRGFCNRCGSSLFYLINDAESIGIAAGSLDLPTGLRLGKHIYVSGKADYYDIPDHETQVDTY